MVVFLWLVLFLVPAWLVFTWIKAGPKFKTENIPATKRDPHEDVVKQRFHPSKVPAYLDAIVIGSGPGSLTTASLLSRAGMTVLVLEQHDRVGGGTHAFADRGLHYLGEVAEKHWPLRRMMDAINGSVVDWEPLEECSVSRGVYDEVVVGKKVVKIKAGFKAFVDAFEKEFPGSKPVTEEFIRLCQDTGRTLAPFCIWKSLPVWIQPLLKPILARPFLQHARQTTYEVLRSLTSDEELIAALSYLWGCYSVPPKQASWAVHGLICNHFFNGASYPVGGSASVGRAIVPQIEKSGGRVLVAARVDSVLVENGVCVGVRMEKKKIEIRAPIVVSGIGFQNTFLKLVPKGSLPDSHPVFESVENLQECRGHISLFIGMKGTSEQLKLPKKNTWVFPSANHDENISEFVDDIEKFLDVHDDDKAKFGYMAFGFPSAKDPAFDAKYPGKSVACMLLEVPYDPFKSAENTIPHKRGEEHDRLKERFAKRMFETLFRYYPQLRDAVDFYEVGTPLCNTYWLGKYRGESYGVEQTPAKFLDDNLRPQSPIPNLYMTGQDIACNGFAGATMTGFTCANAILGFSGWVDFLKIVGLGAATFVPKDRSSLFE